MSFLQVGAQPVCYAPYGLSACLLATLPVSKYNTISRKLEATDILSEMYSSDCSV